MIKRTMQIMPNWMYEMRNDDGLNGVWYVLDLYIYLEKKKFHLFSVGLVGSILNVLPSSTPTPTSIQLQL